MNAYKLDGYFPSDNQMKWKRWRWGDIIYLDRSEIDDIKNENDII